VPTPLDESFYVADCVPFFGEIELEQVDIRAHLTLNPFGQLEHGRGIEQARLQ
jgi:hypothetical protein